MAGGRVRVLHVLPDLAIGGGQTVVLNHIRHTDRSRFDVAVVHLGPPDDLAGAYADAGVPPERLSHPPSPRTVVQLRRHVRTADVVHVHSDVDRKLTELAALGTGVPVVAHLHSEWVHLGGRQADGAPVRRKVRGWATGALRTSIERRTVAHYVASSAGVATLFRPLVHQPISVLRHAVPADRFGASVSPEVIGALRTQLRLADGPVLVNVGRLVPGKGHGELLGAFRSVLDVEPAATLVLVGDGPERAGVEAHAGRLGLTGAVLFLGSRHDVPDILSLADVFVFASVSEGFGLAVLEAMAAGTPVVATRLPSIEEFATDGESALLVERGDVGGLANAVQKVLADRALAERLAVGGRTVVERRFPADAVARSLEEVYDQVLARRPVPRAAGRAGALARRAAGSSKPVVRRVWRRALLARAVDETSTTATRSAVVIAPHPDDETLGCGATIARKRAAGTDVVVVIVTDGRHSHRSEVLSPGALAATRAEEARAASARLGVDVGRLHLLGVEEGTVAAQQEQVVRRLAEIIQDAQPDEVLTTSGADWHDDHQAVSRATRIAVSAATRRPRLLEYPIWFWVDGPWRLDAGDGGVRRHLSELITASRLPVVSVDTGVHLATKRRALAEYRSQTTNLTGEPGWAVMDEELLGLFLVEAELFLPVDTGGRP